MADQALFRCTGCPLGGGVGRSVSNAVVLTAPVTGLARALADGGPLAVPVLHLAAWTLVLAIIPGVLAVRRWQSAP